MKIRISGEIVEVKKVYSGEYLPLLECDDGCEYYVAEDSESAGEAAVKYWEAMAQDDPKEFVCIIGEKRLVQWGMGQSDEYGFDCMQDFLDALARVPEEQWARYDGKELEVKEIEELDEDEEVFLSALESQEKLDDPLLDTDALEALQETKANYDEWQELIEELGFTPTVAYRYN